MKEKIKSEKEDTLLVNSDGRSVPFKMELPSENLDVEQEILEFVKQKNTVTVKETAENLGITRLRVRNILYKFQEEGKVKLLGTSVWMKKA
jgi:predicted ArsR family transcriptional regulator